MPQAALTIKQLAQMEHQVSVEPQHLVKPLLPTKPQTSPEYEKVDIQINTTTTNNINYIFHNLF